MRETKNTQAPGLVLPLDLNLAIALKAAALLVTLLAFYFQDLSIIFNDAIYNEASSHILAVPFMLAYLIYRKRKMLLTTALCQSPDRQRSTKRLATLSGVLLCLTAVVLYWYGSNTFTPLEYHILTLPIFAAGLSLILFNPQTLRQAIFPIAFLAFLTPPPSEILYGFGSTLSVVASEASTTIANAFGIRAFLSGEYGNPTIIITRPDQTTVGFTVDIACSGIYSLLGFFIFAAFIAYITRDKAWKKTTIFLMGLPLVYALNILRITIILLIGYHYGEQLALQVFHLLGGWVLIFLGTFLLLTVTGKLFKARLPARSVTATACPTCNPKPPKGGFCVTCGRLLSIPKPKLTKTDLATVTLMAIAVLALLSIQAPVFALTQSPAQVIIQTPQGEQGNTQILPQISGYTLEFIDRDTIFEREANQEASLVYEYNPEEDSKDSVWVSVEISQTLSSLHDWETCLITWPQTHGYQVKVSQVDLRDVKILENPPVTARYFAFTYLAYNETQLVLYWFETSIFTINDTSQQKQVKISLITYPHSPTEIAEAEENLLPFAIAIAQHWQPMKLWAQIALLISKDGDKLAATTSILLVIVAIFQYVEKRREKTGNTQAYEKMSATDKELVKTVQKAETNTKPTTQNTITLYQEKHQRTSAQTIIEQLARIEKTGILKRRITSIGDDPIETWQTNLTKPSAFNRLKTALARLLWKPQQNQD